MAKYNYNKELLASDLLSSINLEGRELPPANTEVEKLQAFLNIFDSEYNHHTNKRLFPNLQNRLAEYLKGAPSCFDAPICYAEIKQWAVKLGSLSPDYSEKEGNKICANYFNFVSYHLLKLADKFKVNYSSLY